MQTCKQSKQCLSSNSAVSRPSIIHHPMVHSSIVCVQSLAQPVFAQVNALPPEWSWIALPDTYSPSPHCSRSVWRPPPRHSGTYNRRADPGNERVDDGQRGLPWRLEIPAPVQMQPINAAESDWDDGQQPPCKRPMRLTAEPGGEK